MGAALISLSPVWVKLVSVPPTTSGFYRAFFGAVALSLYLLATRRKMDFSRTVWWMLLAASVFFALDLYFWHRSINYIGPGLSTLLANFQVFIMALAGLLLYGQKLRREQLVAMPLAIIGLAMIVGFDWRSLPTDYRLGVIFGLLTAVVYAGYLLSMRTLRDRADHRLPVREIAVMSIFVSVILGLTAGFEGESLAIPTWADAGWLLAYGLLSHSLGMMLIASSLPHVGTAEAGIALLLQPSLSFVWDVLIFQRPTSTIEIAGALLALFAIWLGARQPSGKTQS
jgi:drug/metabolite transporter (DMT)-like permease